MNDEEKAEEYIRTDGTNGEKAWEKILKEFPNCIVVKSAKSKEKLIELLLEYTRVVFLDGLAEGKPKWHNLKKNPEDLPKESDKYLCAWEGGEQWIMDFETEVNSFGYWCNVYDEQSLGFVDSVFETIKERGEDEVIAWRELPKFEE